MNDKVHHRGTEDAEDKKISGSDVKGCGGMILFFDTETTGLPIFDRTPDHESQPHLVQLAAILSDDDGIERNKFSLIVDPGVPIPGLASRIHGITDELAARVGVKPAFALQCFVALATRAELFVAHHIEFDLAILDTAARRNRRPGINKHLAAAKSYCTMHAATPICAIPGYREGEYKWPRLSECINHFFGEDLKGAHDAFVDVQACKRVFFELRAQEHA
jgi:DNA polymerase-3 subunit epsilon